ncbi:MAG: hypothetical protein ABJ148_18580 [Marinobacter sp.]|uniref:hypothetical protein n=1 Tax=Marinobacter sp. TaxID=50741 RepID=UPI0032976E40
MDPSPFVGRDLDANAESFIMEWAEEHPAQGEFRLEIEVSPSATTWLRPVSECCGQFGLTFPSASNGRVRAFAD